MRTTLRRHGDVSANRAGRRWVVRDGLARDILKTGPGSEALKLLVDASVLPTLFCAFGLGVSALRAAGLSRAR